MPHPRPNLTEHFRHALHEAAGQNRWTPEVTVPLMELLPPSGWGAVVRRSDLDALEARMDLRFRIVDARFETIDARFDALEIHIDLKLEATIEKALNRSIRWIVGTMIALTGASVAAVALITNLD